MTGRTLPDRCWVPAVAAGLLALAFVAVLLVRAGGDVSLLVHAAPPWSTADGARGSLTVQPAEEGFDGQFFYRLGVDPLATAETVDGVTYDLPALRNARWGYGALAFVASGGDPDLVPWALVGLNVVAAAAVGAIGGGLARSSGRHAAWGALVALWPGFAYSLSLDTSELVASAFLLGGLLALRHRRWAVAAVAVTAAVLTRDTTTAIPAGLVAGAAWLWWAQRRASPSATAVAVAEAGRPAAFRTGAGPSAAGSPALGSDDDPIGEPAPLDREADAAAAVGPGGRSVEAAIGRTPVDAPWWMVAVVGVAPLLAFGGWQLLVRHRFGQLPLTSSSDNNLSTPFGGLVEQLGELLPPAGGEDLFRLACVVGVVALVAAAGWTWRRSSAPLAERVAWLPAVAVVAVLNAYLWSGATAFLRATTEAGVLAVVVLLGSSRRRLVALAGAGLGGLWLLVAVSQVAKLG